MGFIREHIIKPLTRSKSWRVARNHHIKNHNICAACGRTDGLEVHHIKDVSTYPELELKPDNLITLCSKSCHLLFGHLRSWKSINPNVEIDSLIMSEKIKNRRAK